MEAETWIFPVKNEMGFRVQSIADYNHLMYHLGHATVELCEDYPDKQIFVVFEAGDEQGKIDG